jgi:hypothetical protein
MRQAHTDGRGEARPPRPGGNPWVTGRATPLVKAAQSSRVRRRPAFPLRCDLSPLTPAALPATIGAVPLPFAGWGVWQGPPTLAGGVCGSRGAGELPMPYLERKKVDPAANWPMAGSLATSTGCCSRIMSDKDQLAPALTEKLLTYATGRAPEEPDRPDVEEIVQKVWDSDYGSRSLVQETVQSWAFQEKEVRP